VRTSPGRLSRRAPQRHRIPRPPEGANGWNQSARGHRLRRDRDRWVPSLCASRGSCRFSRAVRAQRQPLDKSTETTVGGPDHEEPCRCASRIVVQRHRGGCPPGQLRLPGPREARRDVGQPAARDRPHKIEDDTPRRPKNIRDAKRAAPNTASMLCVCFCFSFRFKFVLILHCFRLDFVVLDLVLFFLILLVFSFFNGNMKNVTVTLRLM
jgi:hypothetical protein